MRISFTGEKADMLKVTGSTVSSAIKQLSWKNADKGLRRSQTKFSGFWEGEKYRSGGSRHFDGKYDAVAYVEDFLMNEEGKEFEIVIKSDPGSLNKVGVIRGDYPKTGFPVLCHSGGYSIICNNSGIFSMVVKIGEDFETMKKAERRWIKHDDGEICGGITGWSPKFHKWPSDDLRFWKRFGMPTSWVFALFFEPDAYVPETEILYVGPVLEGKKLRASDLADKEGNFANIENPSSKADDRSVGKRERVANTNDSNPQKRKHHEVGDKVGDD